MTRLEFIKQMPRQARAIRAFAWVASVIALSCAAHPGISDGLICLAAGIMVGMCIAHELNIAADAAITCDAKDFLREIEKMRTPYDKPWPVPPVSTDIQERDPIYEQQLREHITKVTK